MSDHLEENSSQLPAALLLQQIGWEYLTPSQVERLRDGDQASPILKPVLKSWLKEHNQFLFKGRTHSFSPGGIQTAMEKLESLDFVEGVRVANEKAYDLLTLPPAIEERIDGDRRSFSINYIDWQNWENNQFHFTTEFPVRRHGRNDTYRPDIVLFVNGIPLSVIECKRPDKSRDGEGSCKEAISQHLRNQNVEEGIPQLFLYTSLLLAVNGAAGKYGTSDTPEKFWSVWREKFESDRQEKQYSENLTALKNTREVEFWDVLFSVPEFVEARPICLEKFSGPQLYTEQDELIYNLLRPERLIELTYRFVLFDASIKKVARYQQYFAVQKTVSRVKHISGGKREGGVIWHTQGSGKSLTMVMLAKAIALEHSIANPRVIIVTDRIDLDQQITKTFRNCGKEDVVKQAISGRHLGEIIREGKAEIITTIIDKFKRPQEFGVEDSSPNLFVLIDESHRSQYGEASVKMRQVLPNACFIAFTGTPLMKKEKSTAGKFGGYIDKYTIDQAVKDGAVVPLLYEGREIPIIVEKNFLDDHFELISRDLSERQKNELMRKYTRANQIVEAERRLNMIALDVSQHFKDNFQGTEFKAQLTAPSKAAAIKLHAFFKEIGDVSTEVIISPPDTREGHSEAQEDSDDFVQNWWNNQMRKYGNAKTYQDSVITHFKNSPDPEIIIVVDKLLTGFDAPYNRVLYLARSLKEHNLLQAIARVNRLADGKDHGLIIDYHGILGELDEALTSYSSLEGFEEEDLKGTVGSVSEALDTLPQLHSDLWGLFNGVENKRDIEAMARHLSNDDRRNDFYQLHGKFARVLKLALGTLSWVKSTSEERQTKYKGDLKFFTNLRNDVKIRHSDDVSYGNYASQIQRLIDRHVAAGRAEVRVETLDITNKKEFEEQVEQLVGSRAKADAIASRTSKYISEKMDDDEVYYRKLSKALQDIVDEMHAKWDELTEKARREFIHKLWGLREKAVTRKDDGLPEELEDHPFNKAVFHLISDSAESNEVGVAEDVFSDLHKAVVSNRILNAVKSEIVVDWKKRSEVKNAMRRKVDNHLYQTSRQFSIPGLDSPKLVDRIVELAERNFE